MEHGTKIERMDRRESDVPPELLNKVKSLSRKNKVIYIHFLEELLKHQVGQEQFSCFDH